MAQRFKSIYSTYEKNKDLISVGAYQQGSDPAIDEAIAYQAGLRQFLSQDIDEQVTMAESQQQLERLFAQSDNTQLVNQA